MLEGIIVRKKKRRHYAVLTLQLLPPEPLKRVWIPKEDKEALSLCYIGSTIRVHGTEKDMSKVDGIDYGASDINHNPLDKEEDEEQVGICLLASTVQLVRCAANPHAVQAAIPAIVNGQVSQSVLPEQCWSLEYLEEISHYTGRQRMVTLARIVRLLRGDLEFRPGRNRPPHIRRVDMETLDTVEQRIGAGLVCQPICRSLEKDHDNNRPTDGEHNDTDSSNTPHNDIVTGNTSPVPSRSSQSTSVPLNHVSDGVRSSRGGQLRSEYLHGKKEPQIRWMLNRIRKLGSLPRHIVDVGGGRGDLAVALAVALESTFVTVVDRNQPSLEAAERHAESEGCRDRMDFVYADFGVYVKTFGEEELQDRPPVDMVVALHACGDLSDAALSFAEQRGCSFLICPCCFTKHLIPDMMPKWYKDLSAQELETVQRLAESKNRELSKRCMLIVNSLRIQNMNAGRVELEEYSMEYSLRNLVLVADRT